MKNTTKKYQTNHPKRAWYALWLFSYAVFLTAALIAPNSWLVAASRYLGVLLAFLFVLRYYRRDWLLVLAIGVTLVADTILSFDHISTVGVAIFCLAQLVHFFRLRKLLNHRSRHLIIYIIACVAFVVGAILLRKSSALYILCVIYTFTLILNLIFSLKWYRRSGLRSANFAVIGFLLFLACDFCVALSFFTNPATNCHLPLLGSPLADPVAHSVANYFVWLFYYPSQIFLANSSKLNKSVL